MPIDWEIPSKLPSCLDTKPNNAANMHLSAIQFMEYNYLTNSCQMMTNIQTTYDTDDLKNACQFDKDTFQITAIFNRFLYKDTKTVRAYTLWKLFSDIGVIIGFFLGVSLMNIPEMAIGLGNIIKRKIFKRSVERRKSQVFIHQILGSLRDEVRETREMGDELREKLEKAQNDISLHKNQLMEAQERLRNAENDISIHKNQFMESQEMLQNAKKEIALNRNVTIQYTSSMMQYRAKLHVAEKDVSLIKNHMRQCSEKEDFETIV